MSIAHRLSNLHSRVSRRIAPDRRPREIFESLESRVMLSGETVVTVWGSQRMEVAKDQYIISANVATAAALQQSLNSRGLYATTTVKLGDNVFGFTDARDSVAQVAAWTLKNSDLAIKLSPNEVYYKAGTTATEITGAAAATDFWQYFNPTTPGADVLGNNNNINAWDITTGTGGGNPVIAVLDTGINVASADFTGHLFVNPKEAPGDAVDNDGNGVVDDINGANFSAVLSGTAPTGVVTDTGHGNDVSTLIAAIGNNAGSVGVGWNTTIMPVVVFAGADETTATDASIIAGLEYVMAWKRQGINIVAINMSFGRHYLGPASGIGDVGNAQGATDANGNPAIDQQAISVFDAMKRATGLGIIVVSAAGNGGTSDDSNPFVPANFSNSLGITVAASTINDTLEPTSNYGQNTVKIAAPGSAIMASAGLVTGSSYAAALVSGAIGLLNSFRPGVAAQTVVNDILNGADVVSALLPYVQGGRRLNVRNSLEMLVGNPASRGSLDSFTQTTATGWLFDPNIGSASATGQIKVDGVPLVVTDLSTGLTGTTFRASAARTDLFGALGSTQHGFMINYVLPSSAHNIQLYINDTVVNLSNGHFIVNNDGSIATLSTLVTSKTVTPAPLGSLDSFSMSTASGWMVDHNVNVATATGIMFIDGVAQKVLDLNTGTTGITFQASGARPDLVAAFGNGNHGFNIVYTAPSPGNHTVAFYILDSVLDANGARVPGAATFTLLNQATRTLSAHAALDSAASPVFSGWMVDSNLGNAAAFGEIKVDGAVVNVLDLNNNNANGNTFRASGNRADLTSFYGSPNHGFNVQLATSPGPGTHTIQVIMLDSVPDGQGGYVTTGGQRATQEVLLADLSAEGNNLPAGNLDKATSAQIAGWAIDPNTPNGSINVRIDIDGGTVAVVPANQFHSNAVGNHGFFYTPTLAQGSHRVDVYALDDFTGTPVLIGSRTILQNSVPVASPAGLVYNVANNTLSGYVVDPDSAFDPVSLQIVIDGNSGGTRQVLNQAAELADQADFTALNLQRPGNNQHGFDLQLPNLPSGNHLIQVYAIDNETGDKVEVLQTPVFANHVPTGKFYAVNNNLIAEYAVNMFDPDSPNQPLLYRVDVDNWTGPIQQAPSTQFNLTIPTVNFPLDPTTGLPTGFATFATGTHRVKLYAVDNETHELTQIVNDFFGNPQPTGIGVTYAEVEANPAKLVSGSVDVLQTVNGFAYFNDAASLGISGVAHDTGQAETKLSVVVDFFLDGNPVPVISTASEPGVGFKWIITPEELATVITPGAHYLQVAAEDPDLSVAGTVDPNTGVTTGAVPYDVILAEGEIIWPPSVPGGPGTNVAAGVLNDVNMQTISGIVAANINDPVPASMANLGAFVSPTATFRVDINNTQPITLNVTPAFPEEGINFDVNTPQLNSSVGNVAHIYYFDPFIGVLRLVATRSMDQTRVFNFVNKELTVSGNVPPAGSIDAASANQIAGWVRDADTPGQQIQYRLDFDDSTGLPDTALLLRTDLPFSSTNNDQNHGFSVAPPFLKAGAHTVKLWAIDPVTLQAFLISQRSFTIQDDSNKRPIGNVDVLTGGRIAGWVQDPTQPTTAVVIEVRVDGSSQGGFAGFFPTTFFRSDIVRNGTNAFGFDMAMPAQVTPGRHLIEIFAIDTTNQNRRTLLKSASVEVGAPTVSGSFDQADFTAIAGWGRAAANDTAPKFRLDVNGVAFQTFTGTASVESGMNLWRFQFPTPPLGLTYNNTVQLYYIDPHTGDSILVATRVIGPVQATTGVLTAVNTSVIQGVALSPSLPDATILVALLIDNVNVGFTSASLDRPELTGNQAGHGFEFVTPPLLAGSHTITVKYLDPITGDFSVITTSQVLVV